MAEKQYATTGEWTKAIAEAVEKAGKNTTGTFNTSKKEGGRITVCVTLPVIGTVCTDV